jgi:uncharacterized protein involved in oxidation of intracellular sulfur
MPAAKSTRTNSRSAAACSKTEPRGPSMKTLFILNDPPYGSERSYNSLRLALTLAKHDPTGTFTLFLMADAVGCAKKGQKTPDGYYNTERMLKRFTLENNRVLLCGTCMDARGLTDAELVEGAQRSTMDELAKVTAAADKVLVF